MKKAIFFGFLFLIFILGCSSTKIEFNPAGSAVVDTDSTVDTDDETDTVIDENTTLQDSNVTVDDVETQPDNDTDDDLDSSDDQEDTGSDTEHTQSVSDCKDAACEANKICVDDSCSCAEGKEWCSHQQLCVDEDACCSNSDCGSGEKCIFTINTVRLCLENSQKACKPIREGQEKLFVMGNASYRVVIKSAEYDAAKLIINEGELVTLGEEDTYAAGDLTVYIQRIGLVESQCVDR